MVPTVSNSERRHKVWTLQWTVRHCRTEAVGRLPLLPLPPLRAVRVLALEPTAGASHKRKRAGLCLPTEARTLTSAHIGLADRDENAIASPTSQVGASMPTSSSGSKTSSGASFKSAAREADEGVASRTSSVSASAPTDEASGPAVGGEGEGWGIGGAGAGLDADEMGLGCT